MWNFQNYITWFAFGKSPKEVAHFASAEVLAQHLEAIHEKSIQSIRKLTEENLQEPLAPAKVPHPIAKNKYEALSWNVQHTMWHGGQLGILKRVLDERYDFGLQKPEK